MLKEPKKYKKYKHKKKTPHDLRFGGHFVANCEI